MLPTCLVFHHEPVNSRGGVESGPWFAMEYASPDRRHGWALVLRLRNGAGSQFVFHHPYHESARCNDPLFYTYPPPVDDPAAMAALRYTEECYVFRPRGLDPSKRFRVTLDSQGATVMLDGWRLMQEGIRVRLENIGMSELILISSE